MGGNDPSAVSLERREYRASGITWSQAKQNKDLFIANKKMIWLTLHNEKDKKTVASSLHVCLKVFCIYDKSIHIF